jgi:YggT family protein
MRPFLDVFLVVIDLYWYVLLASVVLSWLISFNIINTRNGIVATISDIVYKLTEPVLAPIRARMPSFGGLDLSPIIAFLGLIFVRSAVVNYLY